MAFLHGKNTKVLLNGVDASSWLRSAQWTEQADVAETSAFGTQAKTFVVGMTGFQMQLGGMYEDTATTGFDATINPLVGNETLNNLAIAPAGFARGNAAWATSGAITSYDAQSSVGDMVMAGVNVQGSDKVSRGISLRDHTGAAVTTTTTETAYDAGASIGAGGTAFGYVAYLFVTGVPTAGTSPSMTVTIEHSTDNFSASVVSLASFTAATTSVTSQRLSSNSATVYRYLRAKATVTGTGITGGWSYAVVFIRNPF